MAGPFRVDTGPETIQITHTHTGQACSADLSETGADEVLSLGQGKALLVLGGYASESTYGFYDPETCEPLLEVLHMLSAPAEFWPDRIVALGGCDPGTPLSTCSASVVFDLDADCRPTIDPELSEAVTKAYVGVSLSWGETRDVLGAGRPTARLPPPTVDDPE